MVKKLFPLILITTLGLALISQVFNTGWYASHDGIFHIYRTEEALNMLKLGQLPLRWAGNFDQGFGIPLFTFVYPLPYYIAGLLSRVLGPMWALKIVISASYVLGGLGIYKLFAKDKDKLPAIFLSLIYLMTPYQFLNIFVRGAIGEIMALGLMPWVVLAIKDLSKSEVKSLRWYHPIPLALLLTAHNFLGVLFSVFLIGYIIFYKGVKRFAITSVVISLMLASFFLLPMVLEKNLLYSFDKDYLTFRYDQHFVTVKQLIYGKWDYWYSVPGEGDGMSFQLGLAQLALAGLGIVAVILSKKRAWSDVYLVMAYAGSLFLMTARSFPIWHTIPILQTVQFPWRFLFMPVLLTPLLGAVVIRHVANKKILNIVMLLILGLGFWNIRNYRRPIRFLSMTEYTDLYRLYFNKTSTTFRTEILPKWSVPNERYKSDELLVNAGNMTIDALSFTPVSLTTTIHNKPDPSVGKVTILRNYYPGWNMKTEEGKSISISPTDEGMITFTPEMGVHTYSLKMTNTTIEKVANMTSIMGVVAIGYLWVNDRKRKKKS